jgi:hypothetical protein
MVAAKNHKGRDRMRRAVLPLGLMLLTASPAFAQPAPKPMPQIVAGAQETFVAPPAPPVPVPPPIPTASPLTAAPAALAELPGLAYRGGVAIKAPQKGFTGYADIVTLIDGSRFNLVEGGNWVSGELRYDAKGDLSGALPSNSGFLFDEHGRPLKDEADKRAATIDFDNVKLSIDTGPQYLIGFGGGRIVAYKGVTAVGQPLPLPAEAPFAGGVATLADLPGGGFVALTSDGRGWLSTPKGAGAISLAASGGWTVRDLTALPDGDLLLIERKGAESRLSRIAAADIAIGKTLQPKVLTTVASPIAGATARKSAKGETLVYLLADGSPAAIYMFEMVAE